MKSRNALCRLTLSLTLLCFFSGISMCEEPKPEPAKEATTTVYRHVVLFGFKETASKDDIQKIEQAFAKLPEQIDTIIDYEWGTNVSPEGLDQGHSHCFLVTFKDKAGLDVYLPHPAHKKFVELLKPSLEKVTVLDYVSK